MRFEFPKEIVPGEYAITPDAPAGSHDQKFPPLGDVYSERDRYLTVGPERYYSAEHMQREWDGLWTKTWTCAGRASDLNGVGHWFRYDLGRESFIVVRTADDTVEAFYNVCRHRGNRLVTQDFGRQRLFTCSFHGWQWNSDGSLAQVTDRNCFRDEALCANLKLTPVRCETWAGFVFINMNPEAPPLTEFLAELPEVMRSYEMEKMHVVKDVVIEFNANWKVVSEAFLESYHLQVTHPQAKPFVDDVNYQLDIFSNGHGRLHTAVAIPSPRVADRNKLDPVLGYMLMEAGVDPAAFEGRAMEARAAILAAKRKVDNPYGIDYSGFTDSQVTDDWNYSIFPNMTFNTHPEGVLVMRFLPHPSDPEKSYYHVWVISRKLAEGARPPAYMGVEPEVDVSGTTRPARRYNDKYKPELGEVLEQDVANIEGVQQGLRSRAFDHNKYSEQEQRLVQLHAEIDRYFAKYTAP
ncbi:MAG: aromatic ring-hydroxylating dioxygenase subunit alpha [Pseudomonadota bacterium]|nr:aromatic ring-hydroxylating dioxygenase subunit alpha [Pseudomonadota bacterium]